jgi:sporulation protein YlmC with PRC-barrel domain
MTRRFEVSSLQALPIVAIYEGKVLGNVKEPVFDPDSHSLVGLTLSGKNGDGERFVDRARVLRLGPHAVTVLYAADVGRMNDHERAREIVESRVRVRGAPVMTDAGEPIGKVDKVWLDDTGSVLQYRASNGGWGLFGTHEIAPESVVVIGEDVVIVSTEAISGHRNGDASPPPRHPDAA